MSEVKHSPTPWVACGANAADGGCQCGLIWSGETTPVMLMHSPDCQFLDHGDCAPSLDVMKANVKFVVTAVNHHAELVAVLTETIPAVVGDAMWQTGDYSLATRIRTVLAKIRGDEFPAGVQS